MVEEKKFKENCHKEIYPKKKKKHIPNIMNRHYHGRSDRQTDTYTYAGKLILL